MAANTYGYIRVSTAEQNEDINGAGSNEPCCV